MELLASSLRYWVAKKLNTDPGWKSVRFSLLDPTCVAKLYISWKLSSRMPAFQEKANTKSWTLFGDKGLTLVMTPIPDM